MSKKDELSKEMPDYSGRSEGGVKGKKFGKIMMILVGVAIAVAGIMNIGGNLNAYTRNTMLVIGLVMLFYALVLKDRIDRALQGDYAEKRSGKKRPKR